MYLRNHFAFYSIYFYSSSIVFLGIFQYKKSRTHIRPWKNVKKTLFLMWTYVFLVASGEQKKAFEVQKGRGSISTNAFFFFFFWYTSKHHLLKITWCRLIHDDDHDTFLFWRGAWCQAATMCYYLLRDDFCSASNVDPRTIQYTYFIVNQDNITGSKININFIQWLQWF